MSLYLLLTAMENDRHETIFKIHFSNLVEIKLWESGNTLRTDDECRLLNDIPATNKVECF